MKYSEFLELIHANISIEYPYLCSVLIKVGYCYPECKEHAKKFGKCIDRLLREAKKLTGSEERTLTPLLEKRYGIEMSRAVLRRLLIKDLIAYHKKRGN